MNGFKKIVALLIAMCFIVSLSACSDSKAEYESTHGFEFHFYPEEYEEEYSEVSKTLSLEADTAYQLKIEAACESGTMEISVIYKNEDEKVYIVNADAPCNELLSIAANTTSEVTIIVSIEPGTKGAVIGDLLAPVKSSGSPSGTMRLTR